MSRINGVIGVVRPVVRGLTSNKGVGANVLRSAINNAVLTSAITGQNLTSARTS